MNRAQYLVVGVAAVLFFALYLGFSTKPADRKALDHSRDLQSESTSAESLLEKAKNQVSAAQAAQLADLEKAVETAGTEQEKIDALKQLSAAWYAANAIPVAGIYAEQVAELENADTAWSVAGGTFFNGLIASEDPSTRDYCAAHARKAFESAASLNPGQPEHRVNLALVYAEKPDPQNPMQAVMILRDLESKYPDNPAVYNALGRLAIKTGQWQRAIERLEKAWSLDKKNQNTPCLLARAYEGAGNTNKSNEFAAICNGR
jgi:tetratricopeptide (TPR) repeat protein